MDITILLGDTKNFSFRHRLLNSILLLGSVLSLLGSGANHLMKKPMEAVLASFFAFFVLSVLFYLSRYRHHYSLPVFAAFCLIVVILPTTWLYSGGSLSRVPNYTTLFVPMIALLLEGKSRLLTIGTMVVLINGLVAWEYYHPSMLQEPWHSPSRYIDLCFTLSISILASAVITSVLYNSYKKELLRANLFRSKSRQSQRKYRFLCYHDKLTNVFNRARFEEDLLRIENGPSRQIGLFFFDVDGLKFVNDTFGHETGDRLLQEATVLLQSIFVAPAPIYRTGGDESEIACKISRYR